MGWQEWVWIHQHLDHTWWELWEVFPHQNQTSVAKLLLWQSNTWRVGDEQGAPINTSLLLQPKLGSRWNPKIIRSGITKAGEDPKDHRVQLRTQIHHLTTKQCHWQCKRHEACWNPAEIQLFMDRKSKEKDKYQEFLFRGKQDIKKLGLHLLQGISAVHCSQGKQPQGAEKELEIPLLA